jgi:glycopeptide antibiotics resistance protein
MHRSPLRLTLALLYLSALLILALLPGPRSGVQAYNLVPLQSIAADLQRGGLPLLINLLGNIVAFMPVGLLLGAGVRRRGWLLVAGCGLALSALIETLQALLTSRVSDIDDLLLNTLGALLGYSLYHALRQVRRSRTI